jgi:hypothetical protein
MTAATNDLDANINFEAVTFFILQCNYNVHPANKSPQLGLYVRHQNMSLGAPFGSTITLMIGE